MVGKNKVKKEGRCRLCRNSEGVVKITRHHLIPLGEGRKLDRVCVVKNGKYKGTVYKKQIPDPLLDVVDNIVPLCFRCHKFVHAKVKGGGRAWRARLRAKLLKEEIEFILSLRSQDWLDKRYPIKMKYYEKEEETKETI